LTLRAAGYETQSVRNGNMALDVLSSTPVRAVLLDLLMPGMDGFQVIRHLRQQPSSKGLPILVMTAKELTLEERAILSRETQGVFRKQGSWQSQLITEIGRVVDRPKFAAAARQS
jgi:CheY-like chemotaxis protein